MVFDVTKDTFEERVLKSDVPVLVDFWAEWCMPCKMIEPVLHEIADENEGRVAIARLNVDNETEIAASYNVVSIPLLLLFKGGEVTAQHVGAAPKDTILGVIQPHVS